MPDWQRLLKYGGASALGLGADMLVLVVLVEVLAMSAMSAAFCGFLVGCLVVYAISRYWVFNCVRSSSPLLSFTLFWLIGAAGLLLNQLIMFLGVAVLGLYYVAVKLASAGVVFLFNYSLRSRWVFGTGKLDGG